MVHVKKCPCENGRGKPSTEFFDNGKPQIYCMGLGWVDDYNDEPLECCKNCADWVNGEQCEKDFEMLKRWKVETLEKEKHLKEQK